jgi:uncharacterized RDD family membrane protein YckC
MINLKGYYAGVVSRLVGFIIDVLIINIVLLFIGWFVSITLALLQNLSILGIDFNSLPYITTIVSIITDPIFISVFIFSVIFFYYTFFTIFSGHTPGKAILGLRIVSTKGNKISFIRSTIRFFAYIPTLISLGIGFFWIIIDDQRQAWHDTLSGTFVVYTWEARPDEKFLKNILSSFNDNQSNDIVTNT